MTFLGSFVVIVKFRPKWVLLSTFHEISHDQCQIFKNKFTLENASKNIGKMKKKWEGRFFSESNGGIFDSLSEICASYSLQKFLFGFFSQR